jgi:hypothetical protein
MPGVMAGADVTDQLERGYWSSYNVAYFPEVGAMTGFRIDGVCMNLRGSYRLNASVSIRAARVLTRDSPRMS